jgi:nicotinate phosphoribosyltransferase
VGKVVAAPGTTKDVRQRVMDQLAHLHPASKRFDFPHEYPVGLSVDLHDLRTRLVLEARRPKR